MADWIADGCTVLELRNKLINFNNKFRITETDQVITAGAVTSIPVTDFDSNVLLAGDVVYLEDNTTYALHALTLSANYTNGDNALTVNSITFATDIPVNSAIYFTIKDLLKAIRTP
jgi:hypothetical protein